MALELGKGGAQPEVSAVARTRQRVPGSDISSRTTKPSVHQKLANWYQTCLSGIHRPATASQRVSQIRIQIAIATFRRSIPKCVE